MNWMNWALLILPYVGIVAVLWALRKRDIRRAAQEQAIAEWFEEPDLDEIEDAIWFLQQHGYTVTASQPN